MDKYKIRYMLEHKLLPHYFFEKKLNFIGLLLQDKDIVFKMIDDIFEHENIDNPYSPEDFDVSASKINDGSVIMVKIQFPEPENEPLCYCTYMFFDKNFENINYFCIEKGNAGSDNLPFVCAWTPDERHLNHGNCSFDNHDDFIKCVNIHMKGNYAFKREDDKK